MYVYYTYAQIHIHVHTNIYTHNFLMIPGATYVASL